MGQETAIQWCHHTFNPWIGCVEVDECCTNCYAREWAKRYPRSRGLWGKHAPRSRTSPAYWRQPHAWNRAAERDGERRRVFCASLADVLERHADPGVSMQLAAWRSDLWRIIEETPWLDWMLLTKRPVNFGKLVPDAWHNGAWPSNAWAGTTCGTQANMARVAELCRAAAPAPIRFVSAEPMLEPLVFQRTQSTTTAHQGDLDHLRPWSRCDEYHAHSYRCEGRAGIDLVIFGGESGSNARPCDVAWIRDGLRQCREAGVAAFVKQEGSNVIARSTEDMGPADFVAWDAEHAGEPFPVEGVRLRLKHSHGGDPSEWPEDLRVREMPA